MLLLSFEVLYLWCAFSLIGALALIAEMSGPAASLNAFWLCFFASIETPCRILIRAFISRCVCASIIASPFVSFHLRIVLPSAPPRTPAPAPTTERRTGRPKGICRGGFDHGLGVDADFKEKPVSGLWRTRRIKPININCISIAPLRNHRSPL